MGRGKALLILAAAMGRRASSDKLAKVWSRGSPSWHWDTGGCPCSLNSEESTVKDRARHRSHREGPGAPLCCQRQRLVEVLSRAVLGANQQVPLMIDAPQRSDRDILE